MGIKSDMLDAQAARDMALQYQNKAKTFRDQTEVIANDAVTEIAAAWSLVDETLTDFNTLLMNGYFNGPMGPQGPQGNQEDKGDKGDKGDNEASGLNAANLISATDVQELVGAAGGSSTVQLLINAIDDKDANKLQL